MTFLVQFRINENSLIFSKTTNFSHPVIWCNFVSLWKNDYLYIFRRNLMQIQVLIEWIFFWCKNFSPFFGSGFDCKSTFHQESIWVPSINTTDSSCVLQTQPLSFSCLAAWPRVVRVWPCRSYRKEQVALCETCWRIRKISLDFKTLKTAYNHPRCDAIGKEDRVSHITMGFHWCIGRLLSWNKGDSIL